MERHQHFCFTACEEASERRGEGLLASLIISFLLNTRMKISVCLSVCQPRDVSLARAPRADARGKRERVRRELFRTSISTALN